MYRLIRRILLCGGLLAAASQLRAASDSGGGSGDEACGECLPPVMGWSSWNTYRVHISEELIKKQATALVERGFQAVGYDHVNIDDGFFGQRAADGTMQTHSERFPNGMRPVVDYIHALGLRAGIYSDAGSNTCGSIYDNDVNGIGAGFYGHDRQDADRYFRDWGFDFIKIDYCGGRELGLDEESRYRAICRAIWATGRNDIRINLCRWAFPGVWAREVAGSWRIDGDIAPNWKSVKRIISRNLYLSAYAGGGHYNDMDMLEIGRGLTRSQEEIHFGMWCVMSSPLLIGCDLTTIPRASLELLQNRELIAVNQDPLGLQAYVVQASRGGYVLVKDLERRYGNRRVVAFYNPTDHALDFIQPLADLEVGDRTTARDLLRHADLGTLGDTIRLRVAPQSVEIWSLRTDTRLERTTYEAEHALLPAYDEVGRGSERPIRYVRNGRYSSGAKIAQLGGSPENRAIWEDVYSRKGGRYTMTLFYECDETRRLSLRVNDTVQTIEVEPTRGAIGTFEVRIRLRRGRNRISMGNDFDWAPDIDKFVLKKVKYNLSMLRKPLHLLGWYH